MKTLYLGLAALLASTAGAANAASIGLSTNYSVEYVIRNSTSEAGAVSYNWDTNTLLVGGDEDNWNEYDLNGVLTQRALTNGFKDPEGVAYLGNGQFAVAQERTGQIFQMSDLGNGGTYRYYSGNTDSPYLSVPEASDSSFGMEGVTYDRTNGDFYVIKEDRPQGIWRVSNGDFATGASTNELLFDIETLLGLETISDISVLSNPDAFAGKGFSDNLLILSAVSEMLLEVSKTGEILSKFDLSDIGVNKIEGVTLDNMGNIYLVGEERVGGGSGLIKLARMDVAAVPEPATWAMMLGGLGLVGGAMRRRKVSVAFA